MACQFSIPFTGDASQIILKAEAALTQAGGKFSSSGNNGTFEISLPVGKIQGEFVIEDSSMKITIQSKPIFVPCGMIEQKITQYLNS